MAGGAALLLPETFANAVEATFTAVHTADDLFRAVAHFRRVQSTVVDPNDSPTGAAFAKLNAFCTSRPNAVANPFAYVAKLKLYVPCMTDSIDTALSRVDQAEKLDKLVKRHLGSDRDSLLDAVLRGYNGAAVPFAPVAPTHAAPAPTCTAPALAYTAWPSAGTATMPPPSIPPPTGLSVLPPAKRHRPVAGLDAIIAIMQQKCPGTALADVRARTISMLKGRCTACALPRSGTGQNTRCLTPGCVRTHLHPTIVNEAHAI